ncbi:3-beta-hydroxysteroid-Delta(8),Delta(7)-isomerase [Microdochium trichocladiopsis]|uniref:3-beta-hydroxysteroid-Delta(8), Delta(7)-isomerase n=1 Tax=Microdochium trichocladiopsis TaxID=1682393 RepID=A0A9P8Y990_9PEZI|nr:3-beta-hydroxysteroid-Delta(8),Delta(7)-isomerase [Microdochium trichocladiopsis]KAH7033514.1 3-beta-hydroxysteroid-Delta(8),Delta(7)-isomerase [Microdochium trichocladiopsis]
MGTQKISQSLADATAAAAAAVVEPLHPYHPLGVAIPGYLANEMATIEILAYFVVGCTLILGSTMYLVRRFGVARPGAKGTSGGGISNLEVATAMWFVLCGFIHIGMEGYVVYHSATIASSRTLLGQAWKEYSLSDSRYLTQDTFVIPMEAVTAVFWGPLSFVIAYMITVDHPLRHPLQAAVSMGQLYGDVLYYATCAYEHFVKARVFCRPEGAYFWGYFIFLNAFWIVIPLLLLVSSARATAQAVRKVRELEGAKKLR